MNEVWLKSLKFHHKRLYPGEPTIDIEELASAMQLVEGSDKNGFASYSIKNSIEEVDGSDVVSFGELGSRIERTYKDTKDTIYTDHFFNLIDTDGDGAISYADLERMKSELGLSTCMSQKLFLQLSERLNHETTKLQKAQFIDIIRQYI